jgi:hypothetical protein
VPPDLQDINIYRLRIAALGTRDRNTNIWDIMHSCLKHTQGITFKKHTHKGHVHMTTYFSNNGGRQEGWSVSKYSNTSCPWSSTKKDDSEKHALLSRHGLCNFDCTGRAIELFEAFKSSLPCTPEVWSIFFLDHPNNWMTDRYGTKYARNAELLLLNVLELRSLSDLTSNP